QKFSLQTVIPVTDHNYLYRLGDFNHDGVADLFVIATQGTASGHTEAHVLSGATGFSSFLLNVALPVAPVGANVDFQVAPNADLYMIVRNGATGTEVHVLSATSGYQQFTKHLATALPATDGT